MPAPGELDFTSFGSWTLERKELQRGVEPDECYIFGDPWRVEQPHLAIEVVRTSGGLDKREIYRALNVRELWFWRRGGITVHVLRDAGYVEVSESEVLPGIDLDQLVSFFDRPTASAAMREYGAALEAAAKP